MEIQLSVAASKRLVPTGTTMAGYEIQKDGNPLMTIGGKSTWPNIESQLAQHIKMVGDVHLIIWIRDKNGDMTTTKTLYGTDGGHVVEK
jgi:hypothetical protein|uniref:Uncharacterized protein n=1 Tax=Myoviridae sp. ctshb19 TaxID=2825194 RepID=A0A8S5UH01_9CAUD|nr:MAG TPA: hypothetical protein [Myoviridae sp. ctshb19]